jgi:DNA invertase Pin-like site-specific DNA recombinase
LIQINYKDMEETMKKAVIYARTSSSGYQENRQDTSRQVDDLKRYAEYQNLEVQKVFEEHISGGKKNEDRPVLLEAIQYCKDNNIDYLLSSELSRIGRSAFETLSTIKELVDNGINLYLQKEQFTLLDEEGKPSIFAPIMLATLATCAQLERENIQYRLQSGLARYKANGGKMGRKVGSIKSKDEKRKEYAEALGYLKKGYSIRVVSKLTGRGTATIQRLKTDFKDELYM